MLRSPELYLIHGWGFGSKFWHEWSSKLDGDLEINIFDRGYFTNKKEDFHLNISGRPKILITHSFGLHYLSKQNLTQIHLLILISGFSYFHDCTDNIEFDLKQISLMQERLILDPINLLKNFYRRCNLKNINIDFTLINRELLYNDLMLLNQSRIDLDYLKSVPQIILLHGARDIIVNQAHSQQLHNKLPNSKLLINEKAGHALPISDIEWCINSIQLLSNRKLFLLHNAR